MPIGGVEQPDFIIVDDTVRLRKFDGIYGFALEWYQDPETVWLVDGIKSCTTKNCLRKCILT